MKAARSGGASAFGALAGVALVTLVLRGLDVANAATISITYLLLVLLVAAISSLSVAVATSIAAMLCLNFFFLPPIGTFTIADPHNWVTIFAFLMVSVVATRLSAVARARADEAIGRRNELARLFDLSRDVLMIAENRDALTELARAISRRFDLSLVAVAVPRDSEWDVHGNGLHPIDLDRREVASAYAAAQTTLEFDAYERTYAGHRTTTVDGETVRLVPIRSGTKAIGVLAAAGRLVEPGTLDTLAGVAAIAIERARFLEERKAGELTRQSEALKTALLASLSHDLRTPLTAIRIAASNIKAAELGPSDRVEQADLILTEVERLTRLFQNLLEMARIDAGAVAADVRWTHPSEIIAAARRQVEQTIQGRKLDLAIEADIPVRLDPRLTATALAHLLENAAQYSPAGTAVQVASRVASDGLTIQVRDRGPGIAPGDLPRLFERFYRGAAATSRTSGTGMGLWIVRGLLAAQNGRVWAENCPDGGAEFTMVVPAEVQDLTSPIPG